MLPTILGSCFVGLLLLLAVALVVRKIIRDKKAGKSFCGGNCSACAGCGGKSNCTGCSGCGTPPHKGS